MGIDGGVFLKEAQSGMNVLQIDYAKCLADTLARGMM